MVSKAQWKNKQTMDLYKILENHRFLDYIQTLYYISMYDIKGAVYEIAEEINDPMERNIYFSSIKKADFSQIVAHYRIKLGFPVKKYHEIF